MIDGRTVLAIIPARGGSKGLPGKNLAPLGGRPLIAWTIDQAQRAPAIDRLILSSDDPAIIDVARANGCEVPFLRPPELATDEASTVEVVLHAVRECPGFDIVVVLQPTSPLRTSKDIEETLTRLAESGAPSCVSVTETEKPPVWTFTLDDARALRPLFGDWEIAGRRQDLSATFVLNGAVYAASVVWMTEHRRLLGPGSAAYVMPKERSVDIDTELDLRWAEFLLTQ